MNACVRFPQEAFFTPNVSRLMDEFFRRAPQPEGGEEEVVRSTWSPAVDVKETDDALTLFAELPGVGKEAIEIELENNLLTVSGERRFDDGEQESYRRVERAYGNFTRSFRMPRDVDATQVTATYTDGILRLDLPKTEAAKPRQVEIH